MSALVGKPSKGGATVELAKDTMFVSRYTVAADGSVPKVSFWLDGQGSGSGDQAAKCVIYDSTGALVAASEEVTVLDGAAPAWVVFRFDAHASPALVGGDEYDFGLIGGNNTHTIRLYVGLDSPAPSVNSRVFADTYSNGPAATLGAPASTDTRSATAFTQTFDRFTPRDLTPDYVNTLGFLDAQTEFAKQVVADARFTPVDAAVCWHGTKIDSHRGSFAVVLEGGPFDGLLGWLVRLTTSAPGAKRQAIAFCGASVTEGIPEGISVSRRVFAKLADLGDDTVEVTVERLAVNT